MKQKLINVIDLILTLLKIEIQEEKKKGFYFPGINIHAFILNGVKAELIASTRSVIRWTIRLEQFPEKSLLPLRIPTHVLAQYIVKVYM